MRATLPYLEQRFEHFNRLIFNSSLPPVPIELSRARTFAGVLVTKRKRALGVVVSTEYHLRVSTLFDLPQDELDDVLIHEMIHYYIAVRHMKDTSPHGTVFRRLMDDINSRHQRHITISHRSTPAEREARTDTRAKWHVVALVTFRDGRTGIKVLPRIWQRIDQYRAAVAPNPDVVKLEFFLHNSPWLNRFPVSTAYRVHYVEPETLRANMEGAKRLER